MPQAIEVARLAAVGQLEVAVTVHIAFVHADVSALLVLDAISLFEGGQEFGSVLKEELRGVVIGNPAHHAVPADHVQGVVLISAVGIINVAIAVHPGVFHSVDSGILFLHQLHAGVECFGQCGHIEPRSQVLHVIGVGLAGIFKVPHMVLVVLGYVRAEFAVGQAHKQGGMEQVAEIERSVGNVCTQHRAALHGSQSILHGGDGILQFLSRCGHGSRYGGFGFSGAVVEELQLFGIVDFPYQSLVLRAVSLQVVQHNGFDDGQAVTVVERAPAIDYTTLRIAARTLHIERVVAHLDAQGVFGIACCHESDGRRGVVLVAAIALHILASPHTI